LQVASRFARSLRETGAQCQLVMLMPSHAAAPPLLAALSEWRVAAHIINTRESPYAELKGNRAKLVRYWAALDYLRQHRSAHARGRVLLADSRDVIFQRDPFTIPVDHGRPLDVFMEDYLRNFGNSGINQGHVIPCFGADRVKRVLLSPPRPVSCSGITLGSYSAVSAYLNVSGLRCVGRNTLRRAFSTTRRFITCSSGLVGCQRRVVACAHGPTRMDLSPRSDGRSTCTAISLAA